jgi:TonB family protein
LLFGLLGETKDDTVARPPASPPKDADFNSWLSGLSDSSKKGAPEKDTVKQAATPPIPEKNTVKEAAPVKMENVNGVHFTYDTWHSYPAHIIVIKTAAGALAKYNTRTREAGISQLEAKLSVKEWQNFVGKLDRCGIGAWEKRYSVSGLVLDGSSWSLELTFPNNNSLRYSGRNAEPPDWNKLKELMDEMAIMAGGGKVSGSRGLTSIWRALSRNTARPLREAYVKRVEEKPDLSGTVTVKFAINGLGKVTYARIAESTVNDTALENAVVTIVKGFVFDMMIDNIGDVTEVTYPVRFLAEPLVNLDSIDMVFVKGGTLAMGCTPEQGVCKGEEKPAHKATVGDFYIGRREVSQALWKTVMGSNPSRHYGDDNLPVENVSWNDVQEFIKKLNAKTGKKYRLPTEAEWEYAARGGNKSKGYKYSGSNNLNDVTGPTYTETSSTDTRQPNELGIYDMSGNVEEYTGDIVRGGDYRIYRGGHMYSKDGVSYRAFIFPDRSGGGFRLARDP